MSVVFYYFLERFHQLVLAQTDADLAEPVEDSWLGPLLFVTMLLVVIFVVMRRGRRK